MASSTSNTSGTATSTPGYAPQANVLSDVFGQVPGAIQTAQGQTLPSQYTAGMTPQQLQEYQMMTSAGNGVSGAGAGATGSGAAGAEGALTSLGGFNPSSTNNTSSVINAANQYVQGQNIPAQVQQAMQGANQEANEVTLPGINQGMTNTGNQNSSRNALSQGLVQQGLAENAQNMTNADIGTAYGQGLNLAEGQQATNNATQLSALQSALGGGTSLLNGGTAASALGSTLGVTGSTGAQQNQQAADTNALQSYMYGSQSPFLPLEEAMGVAGTQNWGPTTTENSTTTATPSFLQDIAGGTTALGSLFGSTGGIYGGGSGIMGALGSNGFNLFGNSGASGGSG